MPRVQIPSTASRAPGYDPRPYLVAATTEFEALRQYVRLPIDLDPAKLLELAQNASQAILQVAVSMAQAEQRSRPHLKPSSGTADDVPEPRSEPTTGPDTKPASGPTDAPVYDVLKPSSGTPTTTSHRRRPHRVGGLERCIEAMGPW